MQWRRQNNTFITSTSFLFYAYQFYSPNATDCNKFLSQFFQTSIKMSRKHHKHSLKVWWKCKLCHFLFKCISFVHQTPLIATRTPFILFTSITFSRISVSDLLLGGTFLVFKSAVERYKCVNSLWNGLNGLWMTDGADHHHHPGGFISVCGLICQKLPLENVPNVVHLNFVSVSSRMWSLGRELLFLNLIYCLAQVFSVDLYKYILKKQFIILIFQMVILYFWFSDFRSWRKNKAKPTNN